MSKKKRIGVLQNWDKQTTLVVEQIDANRFSEKVIGSLCELSFDKNATTSQIKKGAGKIRIRYIVLKFAEALEMNDLKQIEFWGSKIEEFCISKPKELPEGLEVGANLLMETVARVLSSNRDQSQQLVEGETQT